MLPSVADLVSAQNVSLLLFFVGLLGLATQRNIVRTIIAVNIMDVGAILFLITTDYQQGSVPPIEPIAGAVAADPLPQALMITAIVIGIAVTAVSLAVFISVFRRYGSADWATVAKRARHQ